MTRWLYYLINGITAYRLGAAFLLAGLLFYRRLDLFRWLLPLSLLTDALDGFLARRYQAVSRLGARLDSVADQFTLAAAVAGLFVFRSSFLREQQVLIAGVLALYVLQTVLALIRYGKISSFHTWLAKITGLLSGIFLALIFLSPQPLYPLFYLTIVLAFLELLEEIVLVFVLPAWQADVKGLYWVWKRKKRNGKPFPFPASRHLPPTPEI
ncbi:MAG: CDP-alcohol phosphatidyltransferase family protein [Adhaeribacter sp.]